MSKKYAGIVEVFEDTAGKIEHSEPILLRLKEAFVRPRLDRWTRQTSHALLSRAHEIAQFVHEALRLADLEKPSEMDLRQVEERHKRAEQIFKKLEKANQQFVVSVFFFELSDAEREKVETVRDLYSRELRNAKLELAGVRKHIDEKLVAIKDSINRLSPSPSLEENLEPHLTGGKERGIL